MELAVSGVRVQFLDQHAAVWRLITHDTIDGRLWRASTCDYTYPDDSKRWAQSELMLLVETLVHPDGTGSLTSIDKTERKPGPRLVSRFSGRAADAYWIDRPATGPR